MAACVVGEEECAGWALAGFHMGEILIADEMRQPLSDGKEERFGGAPPAQRLKFEGRRNGRGMRHDPAEYLVPLQQAIQWLQFAKVFRS